MLFMNLYYDKKKQQQKFLSHKQAFVEITVIIITVQCTYIMCFYQKYELDNYIVNMAFLLPVVVYKLN